MADMGEILVDGQRIEFHVTRSRRRRKSIGFRMTQAMQLQVTAPWRASEHSIRSVILRQESWIKRRVRELGEEKRQAAAYMPDNTLVYLGCHFKLSVTMDRGRAQGVRLHPHLAHVNVHDAGDVPMELRLWLRKRARTKFLRRLDVWAKRLDVRYTRMSLTQAQSRWGSYSASDVIRLNWRLIMAPLPLLDYVIVHELCHVRHKNHGARFWAQVEKAMPDWKLRRDRLQKLGAILLTEAS
jgi:predicted metal-dependent hydrolase